jgi:hypothetical protein
MSNQKGYTQNQIGFQPARGFPTVPIGSVTAPGIIAQPLNNSGPQRVSMNIAGKAQQIRLAFHQDALVSPLDQMPDAPVAVILNFRV